MLSVLNPARGLDIDISPKIFEIARRNFPVLKFKVGYLEDTQKAVDITICRRFKSRGMSWYAHKANPLLALKLLKLNGERESYWQQKELVTV